MWLKISDSVLLDIISRVPLDSSRPPPFCSSLSCRVGCYPQIPSSFVLVKLGERSRRLPRIRKASFWRAFSVEQKGEWSGFTDRREWPLDSSLEGELTGFVWSRQSTLNMSWQPCPCLLPLTCLHTQQWRIKRSVFWPPLKGCPVRLRQVACLIMKIIYVQSSRTQPCGTCT